VRYFFYISQNYSFEILRPLQQEAHHRGDQCAWFIEGNEVNISLFKKGKNRLKSIAEVVDYKPDAVFVPGNIVPAFVPGLKVAVFHGAVKLLNAFLMLWPIKLIIPQGSNPSRATLFASLKCANAWDTGSFSQRNETLHDKEDIACPAKLPSLKKG
jgi:hypothetical protein